MVLFEVLGQHNPALREGTLLCVCFQRVEDQEIAAMPITPMKIRTLQRKLYAKAKQEPGYRFYALNDKVFRADLLQHAWRLVKSNKGAPGIDGVSFADIEAEEGVEQFLAELAAEVRVIPACGGGSLEESACLDMKHIGKPCTGERYARFDEGGQGHLSPTLRFGREEINSRIRPGCGPCRPARCRPSPGPVRGRK